MFKERLAHAADRAFRLIAAMLMRRAVAPLMRIDEDSLRESGLSRAAVADFLAMPLGTDPGKFFTQRHEQDSRAVPEQRLDSQRDARDGPKRRRRRRQFQSKSKLNLAKEIP